MSCISITEYSIHLIGIICIITKKRGEQHWWRWCWERHEFPQIFLNTQKNHFILQRDPRDTGSRPPACRRCLPSYQAHIGNARIQLEEEKNFLENLGFVVKEPVDVIPMAISRPILPKAGCANVSTIIIGSRGRGFVKGLLHGSVSADILRQGKTHLLIFRHSLARELEGAEFIRFCPKIFPRILFPTDFSEPANKGAVIHKGNRRARRSTYTSCRDERGNSWRYQSQMFRKQQRNLRK